jgi:ribonuclease Z
MENIKITFLGTSNAVPTAKRSHTSILLSYKNENILIDCGEGTQRQFKYAKISPSKLSRILITHWHGDHILGLPGLFQTLAMNDYSRVLHLYGPKGTKHFISILKELVNIKIKLEVHEITETKKPIINEKEFHIDSKEMSHGLPSLAYAFQIKEKLRLDKSKLKKLKIPNSPLLGKLQQGKSIKLKGKTITSKQVAYKETGKKVSFILDTSMNNKAISLAQDSTLLICESSFSIKEKEMARKRKHLTASDAATIAKKANVNSLILTHISQRYEHNTSPILEEAKKVFKNTSIAKDLDEIEV